MAGMSSWAALRRWSWQRWLAAAVSGLALALLIAIPTAVIPNPVFGRAVEVTWWSYPVVILSGLLGGLLIATYVRPAQPASEELDRPSKAGLAGSLLSFFAVGCPVCNKLVLLALGASGALSVFAPIQPILAVASLALMTYALRARLRGEIACRIAG